jgi:hypothetical protein
MSSACAVADVRLTENTFIEFLRSARFTHYDNLTEDERSHAPNYEGCEVVVFKGGAALCKEGDTYWFEDYKERFSGPWALITRRFYDFLVREGAM